MDNRLFELNQAFKALGADEVRALSEPDFDTHLNTVIMMLESCQEEFTYRTAGGTPPAPQDIFRACAAAHVRAMNEPDFCRFIQGVVLLLEVCDEERKRRVAGGIPMKSPSIGRA